MSLDALRFSLGLEMISLQKDTNIIDDIKNSLSVIDRIMRDENYNDSVAMAKNRTVANELRVIDKLVFNRFGIRIKILADGNKNFGVIPVTALNYNTLNTSAMDNYENMKSVLEMYKVEKDVDPDKLTSLTGNETKVFKLVTDSFDGLESALNLKGLKIDLVNAKIIGLPTDYIVIMMADICYMLKELNLSIDELTAVLFHEIGHAFTHIEYAYRTYSNTSVLIDTIKDDLHRGNNTLRKTLVMAYEHAFKTKMTQAESSSEATAMITIANRYIDNTRVLNYSRISYTDSEQLADQFAGRFGLTLDLTNALTKFNAESKTPEMFILYASGYIFLIYAIAGFLMSLSVIYGVGLGLAVSVGVAIILSLIAFIESIFTSGGTSRENTYDGAKRRVERIVNESVRTLKNTELDVDTKKAMVNNCDTLIKILETYPEDHVTVFDKIIRWINRGGSQAHLDSRQFDELVEDLQSNRVYLAAAKFDKYK